MKRITPRTFLALWYVGALLVGVAVFWTIYIAAPDEVTPGSSVSVDDEPVVLLPVVTLSQDASAFVESLPVLGDEAQVSKQVGAPRMLIPGLGVDEVIVELPANDLGWDVAGLGSGFGHLEGTDAPGGAGNMAFAAHISLADNSPGPLANVEQLIPGDTILIVDNQNRYIYEVVDQQQVGEDRLEILYPTETPTLTLVTCSRWSWIDGRYTSRQVVTASLVEVQLAQ